MSRVDPKSARAGVAATMALVALAFSFIGSKEGLRTRAYRDSVGIPTICIGETKGVRMGMQLTKEQCVAMFERRLDADFARKLEQCVPDARDAKKMTAKTYVAFLSLSYNIGTGGFCRSGVAQAWNDGRHQDACNAMMRFIKARGRVLPGLVNRRRDERALCLSGL